MREGGAKIGPVCICRLLFRGVDVFATRTVDLDSRDFDVFTDGNGEHILFFTHHPRTVTKSSCQVTFAHNGKPLGCGDVSCMDEAVELGGMLVDLEEAT